MEKRKKGGGGGKKGEGEIEGRREPQRGNNG